MKPPLFSCLTSRVANNGSLYGRFLFGPLPIDISLTVATVLRRSLLHSQATFTIVSAEIEGATHEYASLPGIQESVLEILLNLGEIVLTSTQRNLISPNFRTSIGTSPFFFANIRVSGPGIVTAKDINWPKGIFCVKPNSVICTLSSNETLTMRLKIACSLNKNKQSFYENEIKLKDKPNKFLHSSSVDEEHELRDKGQQRAKDQYGDGQGNEDHESTKIACKTTSSGNSSEQINSKDLKVKTSALTTLLNESHFIRIQNKNLISFKTKEKEIKGAKASALGEAPISNKILYQQTIKATQRLLTKQTGSLDSYSIRKEKAKEKQTPTLFSPITSQETIFYNNKSQKKINEKKFLSDGSKDIRIENSSESILLSEEMKGPVFIPLINQISKINEENQEKSQDKNENKITKKRDITLDLEKDVTFQIFPGLSNDFTDPFFLKHKKKETKNQLKDKEIEQKIKANKAKPFVAFVEDKATFSIKPFVMPSPAFMPKASKVLALALPFGGQRAIKGLGRQQGATSIALGKTPAFGHLPLALHSPKGDKGHGEANLGAWQSQSTGDIGHGTASQSQESKHLLSLAKKHELFVSSSSYPVEKVNFLIERDDELAGYRHRIILEVWTNGSISPRQALFESIGSIIKLIYNFREPLRNSFSCS